MRNSSSEVVDGGLASRLAATLRSSYLRGQIPPRVQRETVNTVFNVVHTAVGAAHHPVIEGLVGAHGRGSQASGVPILGRPERLGAYGAALAIGTAAHLDDFDDTHLATVIHPGAACLGAGTSVGWLYQVDGEAFLRATALGIEAQLRIGLALTEAHYDAGWHITGTCGVLGATVTAGLLSGLDDHALAQAIGLAVSQTVGHREGFGSAAKPLNAGKAAAGGVLSASLARRGFTAPDSSLDGPRGFFAVLTPSAAPKIVLEGLGENWHLLDNTYKPYPCGIVSHPAIDAAVALHDSVAGRRVTGAELRCHPLVPELTGNPDPRTGLQARFSTVHGVAVGLLDGEAGLPQYSDKRACAEDVGALRDVIHLAPDPHCERDEAKLTVELDDGSRHEHHVAHARGSRARPLTETELATKGYRLAEPVLGRGADDLADAVRDLPHAPTLQTLVEAATPDRSNA